LTPGSLLERDLDPRRTRLLYRPRVADLLRPSRNTVFRCAGQANLPAENQHVTLGNICATAN